MKIENRDIAFILGLVVILLFVSVHFLQSIYYYTSLLSKTDPTPIIIGDVMIWIAIILQILLIIIKRKEVRK